jgi:hypothetical protein
VSDQCSQEQEQEWALVQDGHDGVKPDSMAGPGGRSTALLSGRDLVVRVSAETTRSAAVGGVADHLQQATARKPAPGRRAGGAFPRWRARLCDGEPLLSTREGLRASYR